MGTRYQSDQTFRSWLNVEVSQILPSLPETTPPQDRPQGVRPASAGAWAWAGAAVAHGDEIRRQFRSSLHKAAARCAEREGAELVVFGHTHQEVVEDLGNGATYFNAGTWTWIGDFAGAGKETWRDLFERPDRYTGSRRLTHVRIEYDADGQPVGRLVVQEIGQQRRWLPRAPLCWRRLVAWLSGLWLRIVRFFTRRGAP
jgi:hypothetical protein